MWNGEWNVHKATGTSKYVLFCVVFVVVVLLCDVARNKRLETLAYAHKSKLIFFLRVKVKRSKGEGTLLTAGPSQRNFTILSYHTKL